MKRQEEDNKQKNMIVIRAKLMKVLRGENINACNEFVNKVESFNRKVLDFIESEPYCKREVAKSKKFHFDRNENPLNVHYLSTKDFIPNDERMNSIFAKELTQQEIACILNNIEFFIKDNSMKNKISLFKPEKLVDRLNKEQDEENEFKRTIKSSRTPRLPVSEIEKIRQVQEKLGLVRKKKRKVKEINYDVVNAKREGVNKYIDELIAKDKIEYRQNNIREEKKMRIVKDVMNQLKIALNQVHDPRRERQHSISTMIIQGKKNLSECASASPPHEESTVEQTQTCTEPSRKKVRSKNVSKMTMSSVHGSNSNTSNGKFTKSISISNRNSINSINSINISTTALHKSRNFQKESQKFLDFKKRTLQNQLDAVITKTVSSQVKENLTSVKSPPPRHGKLKLTLKLKLKRSITSLVK